MSHAIRRYWVYILLLFLGLAIITWFRYEEKIKNEIYFGLIATLVTLFLSVINFYQANDRFFKELFVDFNRRFDDLRSVLSGITSESAIDGSQREFIVDYINLCAEEYMWVKKGRIPLDIWESWQARIKSFLNMPAIREVFVEELDRARESYYGFFEEVYPKLKSGK